MRLTILSSCICLLIGCTKLLPENTQLRIFNNSNIIFDSVLVNSPGGKHQYHQIAPGSSSDYKKYRFIYNYAYLEVYFNNQMLKLQPIDYVGEEKLRSGNYSYRITVNAGSLSLQCVKD
ncbi:hypothetical protein IQ13_0358 [Lacibacter cauensis]|uniref:Lipoprotein n=1 Tax=Lacibacter cauensis TaxID=510947 RepID=A0A562SVB3_9BACT|nr:hypothetical protein [Lacibacter cauensis]TWI85201.1 hypothetical protein IQ13_0358 [Lacibacter cauensis]